MKKEEIEKLLSIRQHIIECHNALDGASSASVAVVKQSDVAHEYAVLIKKIEGILSAYVKFERN